MLINYGRPIPPLAALYTSARYFNKEQGIPFSALALLAACFYYRADSF
jgi:hypothetical protein